MGSLNEATADRMITLVETRRKDLVRLAMTDKKYTYLLEECLVAADSAAFEELLLTIARDVADCVWF